MDTVFGVIFGIGLLWIAYKIFEMLSPDIQREKKIIRYRFDDFKEAVKYIYHKRWLYEEYETQCKFRIPIRNQIEEIGWLYLTAYFYEGTFNKEHLPYYINLEATIGDVKVSIISNKTDQLTYQFCKSEIYSLDKKLHEDKKFAATYQSKQIK